MTQEWKRFSSVAIGELSAIICFSETHHVNLQEIGELGITLETLCQQSIMPSRHLNGTDSMVSLGA